jgi:hypothetical protein
MKRWQLAVLVVGALVMVALFIPLVIDLRGAG